MSETSTTHKSTVLDNILSTIHRYSMIESGGRVLVAVSGGPDSVVLLHGLFTLRDDLGVELHVAHMNHSIRGEESDKDAEYVRELSAKMGLGFTVEKADIPQIRKTLHLSEEEAARLVRYEFLERTAAVVGAKYIAVAHTADDQVETVLINLLRGSGLDGISGMPLVRGLIVRPLINVRRSEVERYVELHDLHPRTDLTNLQPKYTRNRVRLELLPLLRREYNSSVDTAILRLAELARDDVAYMDMAAESSLADTIMERDETSISLNAVAFVQSPLALRRKMVRMLAGMVRGSIADIGFVHIEDLLRMLDMGKDFRYDMPGGLYVERRNDALVFSMTRLSEHPLVYCKVLETPGTTSLPEISLVVESEIVTGPIEAKRPRDSMDIVLDYSTVAGEVSVRNWQKGDRIRPLGLDGAKKVQDVFVDRKIPRVLRDRIPIIVDEEKVLWVAGLAVSEQSKVTDETSDFLIIRIMNVNA